MTLKLFTLSALICLLTSSLSAMQATSLSTMEGTLDQVKEAIARGDQDAAAILLKSLDSIDINHINMKDTYKRPAPLMYAIDTKNMTFAMTKEAQLYHAVEKNDIAAVRNLLQDVNINVNARHVSDDFRNGYTAFLLAVALGRREIIQLLLTVPSLDVTLTTLEANFSAFNVAATYGQTAVLSDLLSSRCGDVVRSQMNTPNSIGSTPLLTAALGGQLEMVKFLLRMPGIDVNAADRFGETPLMKAVMSATNSEEMVAELLKQNVSVNATNNLRQSAATIAFNFRRFSVLQLLLNDRRMTHSACVQEITSYSDL